MNKDICSRVNREIIRLKRNKMECSHILMGRKEYEEFREFSESPEDREERKAHPEWHTYTIELVKVDEDSYFAGAYIPDLKNQNSK